MIGLVDLDSMIYTIAYNQVKAGNMDDPAKVANHVARFIATIETNGRCKKYIRIYQKANHKNFRKVILPEYKEHRETPEFIKLWKPVITETFDNLISLGVDYIETDDAISILANHLKYEVTIISGDKDLKQIPGLHYNPFKPGLSPEQRWGKMNPEKAEEFFWQQVITGDGTDAPSELCGIYGIGSKTVQKAFLNSDKDYHIIAKEMYCKKYGEKEGWDRANLTYKIISLLKGNEPYVQDHVKTEINKIKENYEQYIVHYKSDIESLFERPMTQDKAFKNLFK